MYLRHDQEGQPWTAKAYYDRKGRQYYANVNTTTAHRAVGEGTHHRSKLGCRTASASSSWPEFAFRCNRQANSNISLASKVSLLQEASVACYYAGLRWEFGRSLRRGGRHPMLAFRNCF